MHCQTQCIFIYTGLVVSVVLVKRKSLLLRGGKFHKIRFYESVYVAVHDSVDI